MSNATIRRYIALLVEKGYIERIGPPKGSSYFIKE